MQRSSRKRVIVVTPVFPMPETGADQADRAGGIRQLTRLGFEVTVIAKVGSFADPAYLRGAADELGVRLITVPYRYSNRVMSWSERLWNHLGKLKNPFYLDGAAYEYAEPVIQETLKKEIERERPDIVWFDYTYLWPLYHIARKRSIPIVTRSLNFEPTHFLEEDGKTIVNLLKYPPKFFSEMLTVRKSDLIVALCPFDAARYRRLGAKRLSLVPLRGLPRVVRGKHEIRSGNPLHVFFMGAHFTVAHNRRALDFVTGKLAPRLERELPGVFVFHISGSKIPPEYLARFNGETLINEGFVSRENFDSYMDRMDIAVSPSPKRVGMQQKVFEPLCRGIPLITSRINQVGYPFEDGVHFAGADSDDEYFNQLVALRDPARRAALSKNSIAVARELFSEPVYDAILRDSFKTHLGITL